MNKKTARRFLARNAHKLVIAKLNNVVNHMVWRAELCKKALQK